MTSWSIVELFLSMIFKVRIYYSSERKPAEVDGLARTL